MFKGNVILALLISLITFGIVSLNESRNMISFVDVGAGDSIFIRYEEITILIDGGPSYALLYKMKELDFVTDPSIDYVIITHFHEDHISGLRRVLERYDVRNLVVADRCDIETKLRETDLQSISKIHRVSAGDSILIGEGVSLTVIYPFADATCFTPSRNENNNSLVLKFESHEINFLLMGDAEVDVENYLLKEESESIKDISILKAGHHCSDTSSSLNFLEMVDARTVICSTSKDNNFGHPSEIVLGRFRSLEMTILGTYTEGDIVFELQ